LEFSEFSIPPAMDQTLHEIQLAGVQPVITHPERNGILRTRPERLKKWVRQGCFAQVTGGALTGSFGAGSQQIALRWIGEGLIHFVASDAHNTRGRPLRLQPAYKVVAGRFGEEKARALFQDNRSRPSRGDSCRTFRTSKLNCLRRAASAFSFSKDYRSPLGKSLHLNAPDAGAGPPRRSTGPRLRAPHREHRS